MKNWSQLLVEPSTPLVDAIRVIDSGGGQIAVVADAARQLLGTITDADVRKAILMGVSFTQPCSEVMCRKPVTLPFGSSEEDCIEVMRRRHVRQLPLLDVAGRVMDVILFTDALVPLTDLPNPVVIMAGGLGSRLGELTEHTPKPLLPVGSKPLLETILDQFIAQGFKDFYFSVNYKADMIRQYFGDGSNWGVRIQYLNERERLGTAGALHMLPKDIKHDLVVMNGDILTKINFRAMLVFHTRQKSSATMALKDFELRVPYGVVTVGGENEIEGFEEKPVKSFFINAGIYVLSPDALEHVPKDRYFDMPTLFSRLIDSKIRTGAFPLREYWIDIGHVHDYERANSEYSDHF